MAIFAEGHEDLADRLKAEAEDGRALGAWLALAVQTASEQAAEVEDTAEWRLTAIGRVAVT